MSAVKHSIKRAMSCETLYQTSRVAGRRPHSLHDDSRVSLWAYLGVGCVVQICVAGLGDGLSGEGFGRVGHACCCFCQAPGRLKCWLSSLPTGVQKRMHMCKRASEVQKPMQMCKRAIMKLEAQQAREIFERDGGLADITRQQQLANREVVMFTVFNW